MVIYAIYGEPRSGKTLLAVILGYQDSVKGKKLYSNFYTAFSERININDLLNFKLSKCTLLLDEIHTLIDSRINTNASRYLSYFGFQSGKRSVKIIYTAQLLRTVDLRMRDICSRIIYANATQKRFNYIVFNRDGVIKRRFHITRDNASKYYKMYDTEEAIFPIELKGNDIGLDKIIDYYDNAPTKKAFIVSSKKEFPYIKYDTLSAIYDYLEQDNKLQVKKLLSIDT